MSTQVEQRPPATQGGEQSLLAGARRRFTVDEYQRMGEAGILAEHERVELIDGEIVTMSPIGPDHGWCLNRLNRAVNRALGDEVYIAVQNPIQLADDWQPQPDLAILQADSNQRQTPLPGSILLVIEIADSSLNYDRGVKLPRYAVAGIPESWIFDLNGRRIERHSDPSPDGYRLVAHAGRGESLTSTVLPALTLSADVIFGEPG